jgi:hypothetical protein
MKIPFYKPASEFGRSIPGLKIHGEDAPYPVFNEREIRAGAGIAFAIAISSFFTVFYTKDLTILYAVIPFFFVDFLIKVFRGPEWSPIGFIGALLVKNQRPEYVGAIQKRFAWGIGLFMATLMMILLFGLGVRGLIPLSLCMVCIVFMWMESVLGVCVGCNIYSFLINHSILKKPNVMPACPGGVCKIPQKRST